MKRILLSLALVVSLSACQPAGVDDGSGLIFSGIATAAILGLF